MGLEVIGRHDTSALLAVDTPYEEWALLADGARKAQLERLSEARPSGLSTDLLTLGAGGRLGVRVDLEGRLVSLGMVRPGLWRNQVDRMSRIVGTGRPVLSGVVSVVANDPS